MRVHDVAETVDVVKLLESLQGIKILQTLVVAG